MSKKKYDFIMAIECKYCGSGYDYRENQSCPNCGAVPDKEQINTAKKEVRLAAKELEDLMLESQLKLAAAKNAAAVPKTGKFMRTLIKLIPVWIVTIFAAIFIPGILENISNKNVVQNLQVINEPEYVVHEIGESFVYDKIFTVTADEFFIAEGEAVNALLPEGFKLLAVHVMSSTDGSKGENYYYDIVPYVTDGKVCRANVSSYALRSLPDAYAQTPFYFYASRYSDEMDGYMCFVIDEDMTDLDLCFEETHLQSNVKQLDCVHKIPIKLTEAAGA